MTTTCVGPTRFVTRGLALDTGAPPAPPRRLPSFGSYCFKATVHIYETQNSANSTSTGAGEAAAVQGCPVVRGAVRGKVTAYDTHVGVGREAEKACRSQVNLLGAGKHACGDAQVVMLPGAASANMRCSGEMFFELDGATRKLV